jgi:hypothetical protein
MHKLIDQLAFSVLKKNSLQECSLEELRVLTKEYPYYPAVQLLYTALLKETKSSDYKNELQKTSLFFNSPLWLENLLSENGEQESIIKQIQQPEKTDYEDFNNDELVVENPRPEVFNILPELKEKLAEITSAESIPENEASLTFEPYHTVDYFASQGIKTRLEEKPNDKFGQQLRSFTDWLKTLKTTPTQENNNSRDQFAEEKVVKLADHSVEERNVETEAMAEVWIKQGQPEKAMNIYNKLSLLNPSKSSYFASLIENLKKN